MIESTNIVKEALENSPLIKIPDAVADNISLNREGEIQVYSVPVVRHVWKKRKYDDGNGGLKTQIMKAKTLEEVDGLLEKGKSYKSASVKTIRSWNLSAQHRLAELKAMP
jgi:hypothetical protein